RALHGRPSVLVTGSPTRRVACDVCAVTLPATCTVSDRQMPIAGSAGSVLRVPSSSCGVWDLCAEPPDLQHARGALALDPAWSHHWTAMWRRCGSQLVGTGRHHG